MTNIDSGAILTNTDEITERLRAHLDRGGKFRFIQSFGNDESSTTIWKPVDAPFIPPTKLNGKRHVYWSVNPTFCTVTDEDRQKGWAKGKKDREIEPYIASKNSTVSVVNCLYADFDGKDEAIPSSDEVATQYAIVKAQKAADVAAGKIAEMPDESVLMKEALPMAKGVKFRTDMQYYKDLALQRAQSSPLQPSVIVATGGGHQAYWLLADTYAIDSDEQREHIKWLQEAWVKKVGGDRGVKDLRRILRVPGFLNIKPAYGPNFPTVSYVSADLDRLYAIDDFVSIVPKRVVAQPKPATPHGALQARANGDTSKGSVIQVFKATYKQSEMLEHYGYTWAGDRMAKPGGKNGTVAIYEDDNQSYHHGGEDPLCNGHRQDPFSVFCHFEHNGDHKAAVKAAAEKLGMAYSRDDGFKEVGTIGAIPTNWTGEVFPTNGHTNGNGKVHTVETESGTVDEATGEIIEPVPRFSPGQKAGFFFNDIDKRVTLKSVSIIDGKRQWLLEEGYTVGEDELQPISESKGDTATPTPAPAQKALTVDEVLQTIGKLATNEDLKPGERKVRIVKELSFSIGALKRADHALVIEALEMGNAGLTKTDATNYVRDCVADAKKRAKEEQRQRAERARANLLTVRSAKGKRSIDVGNRQLSEIVGEALQAIRDDNGNAPTIFVRGGALSRIAQDERGYYSIQEMSGRALLSKLSQIADWETVSLDQNGDPVSKAVFPPTDAINAIMGAADWPGMPALAGVVNAPIFSSDGKLHDKPGYDKDTRHYYTGGVKVGNTAPIAPNIERAKDLILNNLLIDFPFKDEASRAHAVAYLLLPFVRDRISGQTPVHNVDAPSAGTGKGLLVNACAYPFLGQDVPTMPAAKDDDEWRKRISSSLMSGNTHLVIDNVNHELDSGSLASAFTQPVWQDRVLGSNREIKIPVRTVWAITANNVRMSQELARRCIWIRLDANAEQPWVRDGFKHTDLTSWVKQHRDELATAAITLIRAWIAKGQPLYTKRTKGSYEQWAGVMGGILETVGIPGFLDNESALYERVVSKSNLLIDFVKAWWDKQQTRIENYRAEVEAKGESRIETSLSSDELFKLASYAEHENDDPFGEYHNLLGDMLGDGRPRSRQIKLGRLLSEHQDKVVGGYKILLAKTAKGMKYWRLEDATAAHSTQHSTQLSQVVEPSQVECVEYKAPYSVWEKNIFIVQNTLQQSEDNKNNSLYSAAGVEHSTHSTQGTQNGAATGGSDWVECQNPHSTQPSHFTIDELIAKVDAIKGLSADEKANVLESEDVEVMTW